MITNTCAFLLLLLVLCSAAMLQGMLSLTGLALLYTALVIWYAQPVCNLNLSIPSSDAVTACAISQVTFDVFAYA